MNNSFFALISRMRNIQRWGLMRNSYREDVQGHSYMTAVIAHALAAVRVNVFHGEADYGAVIAAALYHDATEIITGDLPTPIKYHDESVTAAYKQVERLARERLLAMLPPELSDAFAAPLACEDERTRELVHAADKLSAYIKCVEERLAGNGDFRSAEQSIERTLKASPLPEVRYFLEVFMPTFGQTLDELTAWTVDS